MEPGRSLARGNLIICNTYAFNFSDLALDAALIPHSVPQFCQSITSLAVTSSSMCVMLNEDKKEWQPGLMEWTEKGIPSPSLKQHCVIFGCVTEQHKYFFDSNQESFQPYQFNICFGYWLSSIEWGCF
uniref:Uncharacterized protein n=1 Tax=Sphaerodactylus townsendi TaxID=933632 RepID=A0ACB8F5E9_9SAUR